MTEWERLLWLDLAGWVVLLVGVGIFAAWCLHRRWP
jgi:hypothetical protein